MNARTINVAAAFNIMDLMDALEADLLKLDYVPEVEFDIDGFWDDIFQVILIPKYDIPPGLPNYYTIRRKALESIIHTAESHGLRLTGDTIEDMGEHFYIVMACDKRWIERSK